jgi:hypothetical protein
MDVADWLKLLVEVYQDTIGCFKMQAKLLKFGGIYLATVNAGTVGLFWYDKQQAIHKGWRIPEKTLQMTGRMVI